MRDAVAIVDELQKCLPEESKVFILGDTSYGRYAFLAQVNCDWSCPTLHATLCIDIYM